MKKKIIKIVCEVLIAALTALVTALAASSCQTYLKASDVEYNGAIGNHWQSDSTSCQTYLKASDVEYNGAIGNHWQRDSIK